jgi:hypothetical protein
MLFRAAEVSMVYARERMLGLTLALLGSAGCMEAEGGLDEELGSVDEAALTFCPIGVKPTLYDVTYASVSPGKILAIEGATFAAQEDVVYVEGSAFDVVLETSACASVGEVTRGGGLLPGENGGDIDAPDKAYEVISISTPSSGPQANHKLTKVRFYLDNAGLGVSAPISIQMKGVSIVTSPVSTLFNFTLGEVAKIGKKPVFTQSVLELRNNRVASLYNQFGDTGDFGDYYDPNYGAADVIVQSSDIRFHDERHLSLNYFCNAYVTTSGNFKLSVDEDDELVLTWTSGPAVDADFPAWCGWVATDFISDVVTEVFNAFDQQIRDGIAGALAEDLPGDCGGISCLRLVDHFEYKFGELQIFLKEKDDAYGSVTINVPYQTAAVRGKQANHGLVVPRRKSAVISASGRFQPCEEGTKPTANGCVKHQAGPGGLFNWNSNPPVPDPWVTLPEFDTVQYFEQRHQARDRLRGLRRFKEFLPLSRAQPGQLIARRSVAGSLDGEMLSMGFPCILMSDLDRHTRLTFGPNDYPVLVDHDPTGGVDLQPSLGGAEYGASGNLQVTMAIIDPEFWNCE